MRPRHIDLSCPCGLPHSLTKRHQRFLARVIDRQGPLIATNGYLVPRVWIAYHGLKADDLPRLAKLHGWEPVDADRHHTDR